MNRTMKPVWMLLFLASLGSMILSGQSGPSYVTDYVYASYQFNVLKQPTGLWISPDGSMWIADTGNNVIRKFTQSGTLSTIAGAVGQAGFVDASLAASRFNKPTGLNGRYYRVGGARTGEFYVWHEISVNDMNNFRIRKVCVGSPKTGTCNNVTTSAGSGTRGLANGGNTGAQFAEMGALWGTTHRLICDAGNHAIRYWDGTSITTWAGTGQYGRANGYRTAATFNVPTDVSEDSSGSYYVTDTGNNQIRKIDPAGNVSTFSGGSEPGYADGSPAAAKFDRPTSIVYNPADGFIYVADPGNNMIRRVDTSGNVTTYAGSHEAGYVNGTRLEAKFASPTYLVIKNNIMYVSDTVNNSIRRIDMASGIVTTFIN